QEGPSAGGQEGPSAGASGGEGRASRRRGGGRRRRAGRRGESPGWELHLAERYANLAQGYDEALREREVGEWQNARLKEENARLRLENRRLRRENRNLFREVLISPDSPDEEAGVLRAQLTRLQEKHRRALEHLRRCQLAGWSEAADLDELLEEGEQPSSTSDQPQQNVNP
ncbi:TUSC1 protein, partial [Crotophaga sulcirostris]|nr:TUSC1 protein [Crotophaga sulcirostris]